MNNRNPAVAKKTTKTIELTVERSEVFVARPPRSVFAWCAQCGGSVPAVLPEEASRCAGVTTRTIYRRVEAAKVHFMETPEGLLLICLDSLSREEPARESEFR